MFESRKDVRDLVGKAADATAQRTPEEADEKTKAGEAQHERKAKTAALRAEDAEEVAQRTLRERIEVIQEKLNKREDEIVILRPAVAELEQAKRTARVEAFFEGIVVTAGATLLGIASFVDATWPHEWIALKPYFIGGGIVASAAGALAKVLFGVFAWPPKRRLPKP